MARFHNMGGEMVQYTAEEEAARDVEEQALNDGTSPVIADSMRQHRNTLLIESDIYALADRITDEWRTYRQALRDVTSQSGFPNEVVWPTKPQE